MNCPPRPAFDPPAFTVEGSLFLPEQLEQAALGRASHQSESDYATPAGLRIKDEVSRAFRIACALWRAFATQMQRADVDAAACTRAFVRALLRDTLGYHGLEDTRQIPVGERGYPVSFVAEHLPVLVAPHRVALDAADTQFAVAGGAGRRKSAFAAVQELLNAAPDRPWGMVSNGTTLRLLRQAATLTRPSFVEIDLADILASERYSAFVAVWHVLHASRARQHIWDIWRAAGIEAGTRVRAGLRAGVEQALLTLGTGFLQHPDNDKLRAALHDGRLSQEAWFQQLLRLVYRLIFVFTVEERGLLHTHDDSHAAQAARAHYAGGYALARLRTLCLKRRARNPHQDQWQAVRIVLRGLAAGEPQLALPALGGLFAPTQCPDLDAASLDNAHLLAAVQHLRWARPLGAQNLMPVDYRHMDAEELGSVYESLLELVPAVDLAARRFDFVGRAHPGSTAGNARKLSGSYYTPNSLVQALIASALNPVIDARLAANPANPIAALLSIRVIDPACGSGHFLLAAARRLAHTLATLRSHADGDADGAGDDGGITSPRYRHALREVVAHCLYGVDRNPMAVELARMALWLEGFEEGRPLNFLDHHLRVGDALLGMMDLHTLRHGIAADAFKPLSGDDKAVCKTLAQTNAHALKQIARDWHSGQGLIDVDHAVDADTLRALEAPADTPAEVAAKEAAWQQHHHDAAQHPQALAADALVAAFLLAKTRASAATIPTSALVHALLTAPARAQVEHAETIAAARTACRAAHVLHWPLAFPQVFQAGGGFDCVLGNPPWERIKLQEEEFFATRHPDVAAARNKAERAQRIALLQQGMLAHTLHPEANTPAAHSADAREQALYQSFIRARRTAEATSVFAHVKGSDGGRYPFTGVGDVNTYALFAETITALAQAQGRAGFIVPSGIATDASTQAYFAHITQQQRLASLYDLENRDKLFPDVDSRQKFCLLTLGHAERTEFVCFATQTSQLADARRRFSLTPAEFRLINPNTLTCPVFRSARDAELTKKLYRAAPVLLHDEPAENPWGIRFMTMFHMSGDSHLFHNAPEDDDLPLYEAKLIHQFDHRWATYISDKDTRDVAPAEKARADFSITPRYWVNRTEVQERLQKRDRSGKLLWQWQRGWLLGWRDICRATDERTVIASVVPLAGVNHKTPLFFANAAPSIRHTTALLGNFNALVLDYVARQKVGGTSLTYFYLKQFPILPPNRYTEADLAFIVPRVLELTYTAHDLAVWAQDLGYHGAPFAFDPERRAVLRAELDAIYARLYGLTRDELRYLLDPAAVMGADYPSETFRVLKKNEIKAHGEYRTQRLVLDAWDRLHAEGGAWSP